MHTWQVTIRIDQIKELKLDDIRSVLDTGEAWILCRKNDLEAVIEKRSIQSMVEGKLERGPMRVLKFWGRKKKRNFDGDHTPSTSSKSGATSVTGGSSVAGGLSVGFVPVGKYAPAGKSTKPPPVLDTPHSSDSGASRSHPLVPRCRTDVIASPQDAKDQGGQTSLAELIGVVSTRVMSTITGAAPVAESPGHKATTLSGKGKGSEGKGKRSDLAA